ncbi:hypothetical protein LTR64_007753 [Lithohypha guttulata]|uniref:uncharacterized protein n=1 Tax=Lithohypha guttulata TaxID=1690604 RepID=UPI002DDEC07A|nr:hypothetical protein LTR51_007263 [Lithohypha guttulata]
MQSLLLILITVTALLLSSGTTATPGFTRPIPAPPSKLTPPPSVEVAAIPGSQITQAAAAAASPTLMPRQFLPVFSVLDPVYQHSVVVQHSILSYAVPSTNVFTLEIFTMSASSKGPTTTAPPPPPPFGPGHPPAFQPKPTIVSVLGDMPEHPLPEGKPVPGRPAPERPEEEVEQVEFGVEEEWEVEAEVEEGQEEGEEEGTDAEGDPVSFTYTTLVLTIPVHPRAVTETPLTVRDQRTVGSSRAQPTRRSSSFVA